MTKFEQISSQVLSEKAYDDSFSLKTRISKVTDNIITEFAYKHNIDYEIAAEILIHAGAADYEMYQ
jgi:hypothetical protein